MCANGTTPRLPWKGNAPSAPTRTLAHELAEAATDPYVDTLRAYGDVGPADIAVRVGQS